MCSILKKIVCEGCDDSLGILTLEVVATDMIQYVVLNNIGAVLSVVVTHVVVMLDFEAPGPGVVVIHVACFDFTT